jgi:predicted SnoaL-like aldol condensation-catalyzing enzyme
LRRHLARTGILFQLLLKHPAVSLGARRRHTAADLIGTLGGHDTMTDPHANTRTVLAFYEHVVKHRDFTAGARFLAPVLIQHRNDVADGAEGLAEFIDRMRAAYPRSQYEIKRVFADGDYVILHVHVVREPGARGSAHIDIFRVEGGKVAEHWDVDEPIPAEIANSYGPF